MTSIEQKMKEAIDGSIDKGVEGRELDHAAAKCAKVAANVAQAFSHYMTNDSWEQDYRNGAALTYDQHYQYFIENIYLSETTK